MPAGQIIGRVSVKVLPDTDDFKRDAKKKLSAIEKTLGEILVQTKIDMSGAKIGFMDELRKFNQQNRMMDSRKIRFHATFNRGGMEEEITKAVRALNAKAASRRVKVNADLVAATSILELDKNSLDQVHKELEHFRKANSPLKIKVHPEMVMGATTIIEKRMDYTTRPRTIKIFPFLTEGGMSAFSMQVGTMLGRLSGARVAKGYVTDLFDAFKNLDKAVPIIAAVGSAIAGLTALAFTATSNIFAMGTSLASIGPAALVLPGIFGGMAIGLVASAVALRDFNKQVPAFALGVGKKTDAAAAWKDLQNVMSTNFWAKAKAPMVDMIQTIFPQFSKGISSVSTQLGGFFGGLAKGVKGKFNGELAGMFADLGKSITIATTGTGAMVGVIATLGQVGGGYLPQLAQWFVNITTRFDNFLSKAQADGRLKTWIDTGISAMKDLGNVLSNAGGILTGIGRAAEAAGGSSLGMLADTLKSIHETVDSSTFQTGMTKAFSSAHAAMTQISDKSGPALKSLFTSLSNTMTVVMPVAGAAIGTALGAVAAALAQPAFQKGLTDFFNGVQSAVTALAPAMGPIGVAFGALGTTLGVFMTNVGPLIGLVFTALANAATTLLPALNPVITALSGGLLTAAQALEPVFQSLVQFVADFAPQLIALGVAVAGVKLGMMAYDAGTAIVGFVKLGISMAETIILMGMYAASAIASAVETIAIWALMAASGLASFAETMAIQALYAVQAVVSAASATAAWVANAASTVASLVVTAAGFIAQGAVIVASFAVTVATVVAGWVMMGIQSLINAARMAAAWLIAMGPIGWIIIAVVALVALIIANWAKVKAVTIAAWNAVFSWVSNIVSKVVGWVKANWPLLLSILTGPIGAAVIAIVRHWGEIKAAFQAGVAAAIAFVQELPGKIAGFFSNAATFLSDAGTKLIGGFVQGIKDAFGSVKDTLQGLTKKLTDWKGPESLDKVLLVGAGQLIIEGFVKGLESRYDVVRKSLQGLTSDIGNTSIQAPSVDLAAVNTRGVSEALSAAYGAADAPSSTSGGVQITVPMMPTNSTPEDVADALLHAVRRMAQGGVYAQGW